jgi:hypothetical protein
MRTLSFLPIAALLVAGCASRPSRAEQQAITETLSKQVKEAYDINKPDVERRLLSLYPPAGRVVSASGGRVVTSRDTLAMGIHAFWQFVGSNMREAQWIWDEMIFDVLSRDAAVMTATYHVPHKTPRGEPHTIGGAFTAVFQKRGGRWYIVQEHLSDLPPSAPMEMMHPTPPE